MMKVEDVINRLKKVLGFTKDFEVADLLEIRPNTLSAWKIRGVMRYDKIVEIGKKQKIDLNLLFYGEPYLKEEAKVKKRKVKMIAVTEHMSYFLNAENSLTGSPVYFFPTEEEIDIAFQIGNENMSPVIKRSSYVLTKKIDVEEIRLNLVYMIVIKNKGLFCYRFKRHNSDGSLLFSSDNKVYESINISPRNIKELFCVKGSFLPSIKFFEFES